MQTTLCNIIYREQFPPWASAKTTVARKNFLLPGRDVKWNLIKQSKHFRKRMHCSLYYAFLKPWPRDSSDVIYLHLSDCIKKYIFMDMVACYLHCDSLLVLLWKILISSLSKMLNDPQTSCPNKVILLWMEMLSVFNIERLPE